MRKNERAKWYTREEKEQIRMLVQVIGVKATALITGASVTTVKRTAKGLPLAGKEEMIRLLVECIDKDKLLELARYKVLATGIQFSK